MQTDPEFYDAHVFDAGAAREASLSATLSRVRVRRRMRKTGRAVAVLACLAMAAGLAIPAASLKPGETVKVNPLIVRTTPLTQEQKVTTVKATGLFVRTPPESMAALRVSTPPNAVVPRLGDEEFYHWLALHDCACIQVGAEFPQVLPLHPE
jgi:hypothetical protein